MGKKAQKGKMGKSEKRLIVILAIITIVVIVIAIVVSNNKNTENRTTKIIDTPSQEEEFVSQLDDGTRLNTSDKLHETKTIDGMEITDFQLTEKDNVTLLLGTVKNTSSTTQGGYPVDVKIVDQQGNEIITIVAYIGSLEPGESTQFNTSATFDYANAYDFSITKK